jgi:hypothetical protein
MYVKIHIMLCMKYVEMEAHEVYEMYNKNRIFLQCWLVCNNTQCKLCITTFAIYFTPDSSVQITVYNLLLMVTPKNYYRVRKPSSLHTILDQRCLRMVAYRTWLKKTICVGWLHRTPTHSDG